MVKNGQTIWQTCVFLFCFWADGLVKSFSCSLDTRTQMDCLRILDHDHDDGDEHDAVIALSSHYNWLIINLLYLK